MRRSLDFFLYALLTVAILYAAFNNTSDRPSTESLGPTPGTLPPEGAPLPDASGREPELYVMTGEIGSSTGTAVAIGPGSWLTARHVVEDCRRVLIYPGQGRAVRASNVRVSRTSDLALLEASLQRSALRLALDAPLRLNTAGYHLGYPQGKPGDVASALLGRETMITRGRYRLREPVLAWAEVSRSRGLTGSIGGMSGGPTFDAEGRVIGITVAESPRRGRVYTASPESVAEFLSVAPARLPRQAELAAGLGLDSFTSVGTTLRRSGQVAQIVCLVD